MTRILAVSLAILTLGLLATRAQTGTATVSGTVYAASGSNLQGANVIACLLENDECSDTRSSVQEITGGSSARYQLSNLEAGESYLMLAWKDMNASGEVDAGDELGVYTRSGKPALVAPPAAGIDLRMAKFNGDLDALLAQAEENMAVTPSPPVASPPAPAPASSGLTISGRVQPKAGGSLQGALVIAGVFVNDKLDLKNAKAARVEESGVFRVVGLEQKRYGLFAWRDLDGDNAISAKDEFGVYASSNRVALAMPPLSAVTLQFKAAGLTDYDAMRDLFLPATSSGSVSSNAAPSSAALTYTIPKNWQSTAGGNYVAEFGKDDTIYRKGRLDMQIMAPRAKAGNLATQTRAIWQAETKGTLDFENRKGAVFVRRTASGLNVGVTFGTTGSFDNSANDDRFRTLGVYSVLFVVETGSQVTPIFFKSTRAESSLGFQFSTAVREGRPQMLEFMRGVKSAKPVTVPPLYVEKDFIGKWKETSGTYNATNWYTSSGFYATSTYVSTSFTLKLNFQSGGVGDYFAQLTTVNTGAFNTQTNDERMKWRINGDQVIVERPKSGQKTIYQLFNRGKDAAGNTIFLADSLYNNQTFADLDASPEDTWVVDK